MADKCPVCGRNLKLEVDRFFDGTVTKIKRCPKCKYVKGAEN
jgi:rRNA maturation protein Nop10